MQLNNNIKIGLKYLAFIISGLVGTYILFIISEYTRFTHINLGPFGGPSWALWVYPVYFLVSFLSFKKIFKLNKYTIVIVISLFVLLSIWWYFALERNMFQNPIPFGIGAVNY